MIKLKISRKISFLVSCILLIAFLSGCALALATDIPAGTDSFVSQNEQQQEEKLSWEDYKEPGTASQNKSIFRSIFGFIWKLTIVIILLYVTIRILKLFYENKVSMKGEGTNFAVLDTFYIKPNQALHVVEIVDRFFVLGITSQAINVICEITDTDKIAAMKKVEKPVDSMDFKGSLLSVLGKKRSPVDERIAQSSQKILDHINKLSGR
ncbi:MAG: hypothetical protein DKM50_10100 [Candidatus Margulisiibacteriota bacterium]|nr:MAG: hypothetical protein A2X43_04185 [Candidatus Margulisbacteria bacterium GWD2_39_127]OGI05199.1 MAG: hypothetical protein A2X42_02695 [Candidatus Margulisbacteria bacterium GWF2_38_17]OGI06248.1 MAG: hypothetical protein A2X41_08275 [Candidatus Margulisbacteria bacterium GWE2_39_32]PZM78904.1 MAG: hypothetical protein DKM50_10100 [Candidatus Margulisiibacteriota bacterium]HAR64513.1 hypothetical protein [Candidatus Margulisiibacteriota bacterium]